MARIHAAKRLLIVAIRILSLTLLSFVTDVFHTISVGEHAYAIYISSHKKSYADAKAHCEAKGSYLYHFDSVHEIDVIRTIIVGYEQMLRIMYFGATDLAVEGQFVSERDGSIVNDNPAWDWRAGEPNNSGGVEHCAGMVATDFKIGDLNCIRIEAYQCKKDMYIPVQTQIAPHL